MSNHNDDAVEPGKVPGRRKDGEPYAPGNTRDDGSFEVGKGRTPATTRFAKDDGRRRGKRAKGTRNAATDWKEELAEKIVIRENGKTSKHTKQRAIIKSTIGSALKGNIRAAQVALSFAHGDNEQKDQLSLTDRKLLELYVTQRSQSSDQVIVGDDRDLDREPTDDIQRDLEADGQDLSCPSVGVKGDDAADQ